MKDKDTVVQWLFENWVLNAYIIRGIQLDNKGFRCNVEWQSKKQIDHLIAYWDDEQGGTIRCSKETLQDRCIDFKRAYPEYEFYDLNASKIGRWIYQDTFLKGPFKWVAYVGMEWNGEHQKTDERYKHCFLDVHAMKSIQAFYKANYGKMFSDYSPENRTYYGTFEEGHCVAVACVEMIDDAFRFLSNVFVSPQYRNRGIAKSLLRYILELYHGQNVGLYVASENEIAMKLYHNLGFNKVCKTFCLERES